MKTTVLIGALLFLPFLTFSQKGNGKGHGHHGYGKYNKQSYVYVNQYYGPPKVVYVTKKHKGPPPWAPAYGYRHRNIYFPQYKCYYDTFDGVYIYLSGHRWVRTFSPPAFMLNVDLSLARKVELDLDVAQPQVYYEQHVVLYPPIP